MEAVVWETEGRSYIGHFLFQELTNLTRIHLELLGFGLQSRAVTCTEFVAPVNIIEALKVSFFIINKISLFISDNFPHFPSVYEPSYPRCSP